MLSFVKKISNGFLRCRPLAVVTSILPLLVLLACGGGSDDSGHQVKPENPAITSFSAAKSVVTVGKATTLTAVFSGGTGVIDKGVGTVVSTVPVDTGNLTQDTEFTLTVTGESGTTPVKRTCTVTTVPAPVTPVVTAPVGPLVVGQVNCTASVPMQEGMDLSWNISGGTITSGGNTAQVMFAAGAAGTLQLTCKATNAAGDSLSGAAAMTVKAATDAPVVNSFTASQYKIAAGSSTTLSWNVDGATRLLLGHDNTSTDVSGQMGLTVTPLVTTTYSLYASNPLGTTTPAPTVTVTVVPLPAVPVISVASTMTAGRSGYSATATDTTVGCSFAWTISGGTFAGGATTAVGDSVSITTGSGSSLKLGCSATTADGVASTSTQTTIPLVAAPSIESFSASSTRIVSGTSTTLTAKFSHGTGVIDQSVGAVTSGASKTVTPTSTTTYTLTVTNAANDSVTSAPVKVSVVPAVPTITVASKMTVDQSGYDASVAALDGHTYTWSISGGTFADGSNNTVGNAVKITAGHDASKSLVLTCVDTDANQQSSDPATQTVTLLPAPVITDFIASPPSIVAGEISRLIPSFSNGSGSIDQTVGTVTSDTPSTVSPGSNTTYTLTVTNGAGTSVTRQTTLTVIPAPPTVIVASKMTVDQSGYDASVIPLENNTYAWSITGGTFADGSTSATGLAVKITAGHDVGNPMVLSCVATDTWQQSSAPATANITLVAAPLIADFTASPASIMSGENSSLVPVFSNGSGRIDQLIGNVTSGSAITVRPAVTTTYTLTVTNDAGTAVTRQVTITIIPSLKVLAGSPYGYGHVDGVGSLAAFCQPVGIAMDASGTLYVSDSADLTIRKIAAGGLVSTLAGSAGVGGNVDDSGSQARFSVPSGMAVDGSGNLLVADRGNCTIRKITPDGTVTTFAGTGEYGSTDADIPTQATFGNPTSIAVAPSGIVYVLDSGTRVIRKILPDGKVSTLAGSPGQMGTDDGMGSAARFLTLTALAVDASGMLYVTDASCLRTVTPDGNVTTLTGYAMYSGHQDGSLSQASFGFLQGVAVDGTDIYVSDYLSYNRNSYIRKIASGQVITLFGGDSGGTDGPFSAAQLRNPAELALDPQAGLLYVADADNSAIRQIDLAGKTVTTVAGRTRLSGTADAAGADARFYSPAHLSMAKDGRIIVADTENGTVRAVTSAGVVTTLVGIGGQIGDIDGPVSSALLVSPVSAVEDPSGQLFIAELNYSVVRKLSGGMVSTYAGQSAQLGYLDAQGTDARFSAIAGLCLTPSGSLIVADRNNSVIRKIDGDGNVTTLAGSPQHYGSEDGSGSSATFGWPAGVLADSQGNIFVADHDNHTIRKVTPNGVVTTLAGLANNAGLVDGNGQQARLTYPQGLAIDSKDNLYVACGNSIRKITPAGDVTTLIGKEGLTPISLGPLSAATLSGAYGVAVSSDDMFLYISVPDAILVAELP